MKHLKYLNYVLRHKWYVFIECCKEGIPFLGLIHDLSKFRPSEWFPYTDHFYGKNSKDGIQTGRNKTGYYKPYDTGDEEFDFAWLLHQKRNKHHWQWWILPMDDGGVKIFDMPLKYRKEMLCDWKGASRAQGKSSVFEWYKENKNNMQLSKETRYWIELKVKI